MAFFTPPTTSPVQTQVYSASVPVVDGDIPIVIGRQTVQQARRSWGGSVTNVDDGSHPEDKIRLPWCIDAKASYLYYDCSINILLDPGTVLHKPLPQRLDVTDTLASVNVSEPEAQSISLEGINLKSFSSAVDLIQKMATSTYAFVLRGTAYRAGYQVPIPGLVKIGSLSFVPTFPQVASNKLAGSLLGGIPLWYATWELHYLITTPSQTQVVVAPANLQARVRPDSTAPATVGVPRLPTDQNAVRVQGETPSFASVTLTTVTQNQFFRR